MPYYNVMGNYGKGKMMALDFLNRLSNDRASRELKNFQSRGRGSKQLGTVDLLKQKLYSDYANELANKTGYSINNLNGEGRVLGKKTDPAVVLNLLNKGLSGNLHTKLDTAIEQASNPNRYASQWKTSDPFQQVKNEELLRQKYLQETGQQWNDTPWTIDWLHRLWNNDYGKNGATPQYRTWKLDYLNKALNNPGGI